MHGTDTSLEQHCFAQLRPLKISSEILATFACTLAVTLASLSQAVPPWLYGYCGVAAITCYLTVRARSTRQLWLSGLLLLCTCTACLGALASALGNPLLWFLPIGLVLSLPAAINASPLAGVSVTLSAGLARHVPGEPVVSLMRRADHALYSAKIAGKNRYAISTAGTECGALNSARAVGNVID